MPTVTRILNFSSGPAVLPVPVLEQVQRDLLALPGDADAIVRVDHRSGADQAVTAAQQLRADRALGATGRRLELAGRIRRSPLQRK